MTGILSSWLKSSPHTHIQHTRSRVKKQLSNHFSYYKCKMKNVSQPISCHIREDGWKRISICIVIDLGQTTAKRKSSKRSRREIVFRRKRERADFEENHEGCLMSNFQSDIEFYYIPTLLLRNGKRRTEMEWKDSFFTNKDKIFIKFSHVHLMLPSLCLLRGK